MSVDRGVNPNWCESRGKPQEVDSRGMLDGKQESFVSADRWDGRQGRSSEPFPLYFAVGKQ